MAKHPKINRKMQRAFADIVERAMEEFPRSGDDDLLELISEGIAANNGQPAGGWDNWFWETENDKS